MELVSGWLQQYLRQELWTCGLMGTVAFGAGSLELSYVYCTVL